MLGVTQDGRILLRLVFLTVVTIRNLQLQKAQCSAKIYIKFIAFTLAN